jgi:hypothetical protein
VRFHERSPRAHGDRFESESGEIASFAGVRGE